METRWKKIEIIFASSDKDENSFKEYYGEMPWLAIPLGDERKSKLSETFQVSGIPWLAILDKNGNLIQNEADSEVQSSGYDAIDKWLKK